MREAEVLDGVADLRLAEIDGARVRFRAWDGTEHVAPVEEVAGSRVPASYGVEPENQRTFSARIL